MTSVVAFFVVLFFYIHIYFHLKKSNDLDVYHINYPSKEKFEDICELKQPIIFHVSRLESIKEKFYVENLLKMYSGFEVHVRYLEKERTPHFDDDYTNKYNSIKLKDLSIILEENANKKVVSERNQEFLDETGLVKLLKQSDFVLRPNLVSSCEYDVLFGEKDAYTPLRYHLHYKNIFMLARGKAKVKMAAPKNSKHLSLHKDYDNFEFYTKEDIWDTSNEELQSKIHFLEVEMKENDIISIPTFWFYSIKFMESNTVMFGFFYHTYMSYLAASPDIAIHALQKQNIKYSLQSTSV
tara:strand:- start:1663 stop:2550 length:888 start_codon:yes stop_codon:yes gene_type:complete